MKFERQKNERIHLAQNRKVFPVYFSEIFFIFKIYKFQGTKFEQEKLSSYFENNSHV